MSLRLRRAHLEQMQHHGEAVYPEECVGLLLGEQDGGLVAEVLPLENHHRDRCRRVEIHPLDYLRAEKRAADHGLEVRGYYHSHPDHPACPSQIDLEQALCQDWSYVIIPVSRGKAGEVRSWSLVAPSRFGEEEIELCP